MKYKTGNPVGSSDPRDLFDNASVADSLVNGSQPAYSDRRGAHRKSWSGFEAEFAAFIASSGYQFAGDYTAGVEITGYQQVVRDSQGELWRASGSTDLPYTTTGAGLPEGGAFVAVGDAALRQELNTNTTGQGSDQVKHTGTTDTVTQALNKRPVYVESVAELETLPAQDDYLAIVSGTDFSGVYKYNSAQSRWEDVTQSLSKTDAADPAFTDVPGTGYFDGPDTQNWSGDFVKVLPANYFGTGGRAQPIKIMPYLGGYMMLYTTLGPVSSISTHLAFSEDCINWVDSPANPILDQLDQGWQGTRSLGVDLVYDEANKRWAMFCLGDDESASTPGDRAIGIFHSTDLETWTAYAGNPVITINTADISAWAPAPLERVDFNGVVKLPSGKWAALIGAGDNAAGDVHDRKMGVLTADSLEGPWTGGAHNPILPSPGAWLGNETSLRSPVYYDGRYWALLQKGVTETIGFAYSYDFFSWTESANNPYITSSENQRAVSILPFKNQWAVFSSLRSPSNFEGVIFSSNTSEVVPPTPDYRKLSPFWGALLTNNVGEPNQSIPNATPTVMTFNLPVYDLRPNGEGDFYTSSASNKFVVPAGVSVVQVTACARWAANSSGYRYMYVSKNGVNRVVGSGGSTVWPGDTSFEPRTLITTAPFEVVEGDEIQVIVEQNSGAALDILSDDESMFSISVLG